MSNLNFLRGKSNYLPQENFIEEGAFYLTEDTYDFYYGKNKNSLIKFFSNPKLRIKEIKTYFSKSTVEKPDSYPPSSDWSPEEPDNFDPETEIGAWVKCTIYMDGHYEYSDLNELITAYEIDQICRIDEPKRTSKLGEAVIGEMKLNTE